jgi:hypothetical protein
MMMAHIKRLIIMRANWIVAIIFALQTVLLGAHSDCACHPTQVIEVAVADCEHPANSCDDCCCSIVAPQNPTHEPATVGASPTISLAALPTGSVHPSVTLSRPTVLRLTAQDRPTDLWSALTCAERAPPLS